MTKSQDWVENVKKALGLIMIRVPSINKQIETLHRMAIDKRRELEATVTPDQERAIATEALPVLLEITMELDILHERIDALAGQLLELIDIEKGQTLQ